jgi:hypothetical protein
MYPKNAAAPERIAVGPVVQISDGAVQTSGVTVSVAGQGGSEGGSAGTIAYSTGGIVLYTPTQAETNFTSFIVTAYKTGCIPAGVTVVTTESAIPGRVSLGSILGTALSETSGGLIVAAFKKFFDKATPTGTINSIPDAVAGANGGLGTTNGTKFDQTVDLTAGQSIACSDKTGFSLAATGADLILKSSTFIQAICNAVSEFATYGLTALNTLLVTTGIKAATIPAATLAANQHVIVDSGTVTAIPDATVGGYAAGQDPVTLMNAGVPDVNVKTETNHDFTALQKTSLNAATPAVSVGTGGIQSTSFAAGAIDASALATDAGQELADALLDRANAIETDVTPRQAIKVGLGANAGVVSGAATTTVLVKNPAGTKTRVTATVDADGNRSAITLTDLT